MLLARELGVGRLLRLGRARAHGSRRRPAAIEAASGACLLVAAQPFADGGGFDEHYFLYGEDVDLCLRLRAEGVSVGVVGEAVAVHAAGSGSGRSPEVWRLKGRAARRSHYLLLQKYRSQAMADRYLAGLTWVLRARLAVAGPGRPDIRQQDGAALSWATAELGDRRRARRDLRVP